MDALIYLEPVLRSKKEQLTPQEAYLMQQWKVRAQRDFFIGGIAGSLVPWLATKRLPRPPRIALCAGTGAVSGIWLLKKSLESTVEYFLSLQGTRVQGELAHIMLKKHQNDPWVRQRVSKYYYPEVVYHDSSVDKALYRWRHRNSSGDHVTPESRAETNSNENDVKMTTKETKQVYASAAVDGNTAESPFDLVFELPDSAEEAPQPDAPRLLSRKQKRREKRLHLHRRQRHARHEEAEI